MNRASAYRTDLVAITPAAVLVGANAWLAAATFDPIARGGRDVQYVLVSASFRSLVAAIVGSFVVLLVAQAASIWRHLRDASTTTFSRRTAHLRPFAWMVLSLLPLANLSPALSGRLPAFSYVLFELRWWWWALIVWTVAWRLIPRPSNQASVLGRVPDRWLAVTLIAVPIAIACAFTPNLRWSGTLHGDEPKYLRYCENFYQGLGFNIANKKSLVEVAGHDEPRLFDNLKGFIRAVPEEISLLAADVRRTVGADAPPRLLSQKPTPQMFFEGKHPGSVYQLHNPGLSFLLFPGYYVDRRFTGSGIGYQEEFPDLMPAVHGTLLALYAAYGLALYSLLRAFAGDRLRAFALAFVGVTTLPASAFPFQIYPEIPAGIIIFLLTRALIQEIAPSSRAMTGYGALAGFLPWLHVRFALATVVFIVWAMTMRRSNRTARTAFVAGAAIVAGALSLYTYRLTGSLVPIATYGDEAPLSIARVVKGVPAFAFDRIWGLFPHSPVYLFALPGIGLAWRRTRDVAWIALVIAAVVVPAAAHGFWAGGSTPGRYLVAAAPLLLLFVGETIVWGSRSRLVTSGFLAAVLLSIETAVRYNLYHAKEFGPLVANDVSGWRFNLLFPSLGTETWTGTPIDIALLVAWIAIACALAAWPWMHRLDKVSERSAPFLERAALGDLFAALGLVALVGMGVGVMTGQRASREYLIPAKEARERALLAFTGLPHCALCVSSAKGVGEPTRALGNDVGFLDLHADPASPRPGEATRLRIRPRTPDGEYVLGTLRLDFGDGVVAAYPRLFEDLEVDHVYARPGEYTVHAWFRASNDQPALSDLALTVR